MSYLVWLTQLSSKEQFSHTNLSQNTIYTLGGNKAYGYTSKASHIMRTNIEFSQKHLVKTWEGMQKEASISHREKY